MVNLANSKIHNGLMRVGMRIVVAVVFLVLTTSSAVAQENERGSLAGENQKLRSQIKQMEKQLAKAEAAGFHFNENGYSSVLEIVKELPRELGVKNSVVWDNVESEKVAKFVSDMGVGSSIKVKHRVKVTTKVNPSYRNNDKLPPYEMCLNSRQSCCRTAAKSLSKLSSNRNSMVMTRRRSMLKV